MLRFEDYLDFLDPNEIRVKGQSVAIDAVLARYREGATVGEIQAAFPTLSVREIVIAIIYDAVRQVRAGGRKAETDGG